MFCAIHPHLTLNASGTGPYVTNVVVQTANRDNAHPETLINAKINGSHHTASETVSNKTSLLWELIQLTCKSKPYPM